MSPSAHTRNHGDGILYLREYLPVLARWGRRVVNGDHSFALEISKVRQHAGLEAAGILSPRTLAVAGRSGLKAAARSIELPFITKHNQGGKGLGVQLFRNLDAFQAYVDSDAFVDSPDGVTLLQRYIEPPEPFITRVEIVGGRFLYAIRSSTAGGFELCPADACEADTQFCPVGGTGKFTLREDITADDPMVRRYVAYCATHRLDVAGIEFVEDAAGSRYTYDVNANSNYNSSVEEQHGLHGMGAIAELCARELARAHPAVA
jgi:hypothetical protein